jgi:hypothetical protein
MENAKDAPSVMSIHQKVLHNTQKRSIMDQLAARNPYLVASGIGLGLDNDHSAI